MQRVTANEVLAGDFIQARRFFPATDTTSDQWISYEFIAAGSEGTVVTGCALGPLDSDERWEFEVISRVLVFPEYLCEIDATLTTGATIRLMGRGQVWSSVTDGRQVTPTEIALFVEVP